MSARERNEARTTVDNERSAHMRQGLSRYLRKDQKVKDVLTLNSNREGNILWNVIIPGINEHCASLFEIIIYYIFNHLERKFVTING